MSGWMDLELARERRRELLREAEGRRLAREAARLADGEVEEKGVKVRWGLAEDDAAVADLLQLNGMPRWVAFEERFVVAEKNGKLVGAVRYATEAKRLTLGLLVVDPWAEERRVAGALYAGSRELAQELGVNVVVASGARANYPRAAGFRHLGRTWRVRVTRPDGGSPSGGRWGRMFGLWGTMAVPFYRAFR